MAKIYEFEGKISSTTKDGRAAIVRVNKVVDGNLNKDVCGKYSHAVISASTRGRLTVMNGVGQLEADTKVRGTAHSGFDALTADTVELIEA